MAWKNWETIWYDVYSGLEKNDVDPEIEKLRLQKELLLLEIELEKSKQWNIQQSNESNEIPLDFQINNVSATINKRRYVLRNFPEIHKSWNTDYYVIFTLKRDSNSSLRWSETVKLNFFYDWKKVIFYKDLNWNNTYQFNEWGNQFNTTKWKIIQRYNGWKIVTRWWKDIPVTLRKDFITSWYASSISFNLDF